MRLDFRTAVRGYELVLSQDLFGAFILYRRWFGMHNHRGGLKQQVFEDEKDASREVESIWRTREKHGYKLIARS
jgi:predicted DNA-binding WGR domain protein